MARIGPHPRPLSIAAAMERGAEMIRLALQQFMVRRRRSLTRMAVGGLLGDRLDTPYGYGALVGCVEPIANRFANPIRAADRR